VKPPKFVYSGPRLNPIQEEYVRIVLTGGRVDGEVEFVHQGRWRAFWANRWNQGYAVGAAVGIAGMAIGQALPRWF
jgi:hypothetical protein